MYKIVFFSIRAYGHTNPTLELVRELVNRGCEVTYYSYNEFKEKIEEVGAIFKSCEVREDLNMKDITGEKISKDISLAMKLLVDSTLVLDDRLTKELLEYKPDCIISDSMALWGKLVAEKLKIPFISSTTTFVFNKESSRIMKSSFGSMINFIFSLRKGDSELKRLEVKGYKNLKAMDLMANDPKAETIIYTSEYFQPASGSFSENFHFIGPSIKEIPKDLGKKRPLLYISLGTVINDRIKFFKKCIAAFKDSYIDVIISIGNYLDISELGILPENIKVLERVDPIQVLSKADVFISHCGMNSVNESLYYEVPLVLYPQTDEQRGVANRVQDLGAGEYLLNDSIDSIRETVEKVLNDKVYKEKAREISKSFKNSGGPKKGADIIIKFIKEQNNLKD